MDLLNPESAMAMTQHRREAVRLAKNQERAVAEKCKRSGVPAPGYLFDELIGKGSFGRVYKGSKKVVAIKVIDIDDADYRAYGDQKDEQINDFNKEIRILRQAQESGAPNLNQMIEALPVHSQLWLVCEYCPGGSVKTLMRATNDKLGERYIIVVARELSKALKGLHDAGIMHRDIKAANVLIHEDGQLQLCDFGVATVLDKKTDKRRTFIGTLHWMPPELWDKDPEYSDEVDVWAFGCTLYECAVGKPPNADIREPQQLKTRMRRLNQSIELPAKEHYSAGLRSLVAYTLTPDASVRPSFSDVLEHELLENTEQTHPTSILSELVKVYYGWLYGGGQRASLFMPGGAAAGDGPGALSTPDEEWNFSATDHFENRMSTVLNIPDFSDLSDWADLQGESTPKAANADTELTDEDKANFEERVRRGADLANLFDPDKPEYAYVAKQDFRPIQKRRTSDLPLRAMSEERPYSIANQVIDLGDFDSSDYAAVKQAKEERIKLADAATIKANRGNSKLYPDPAPSDSLPTKSSSLDLSQNQPRPPTQDFSFPPKEWNQPEPATESKSRDAAKHRTMEWSFESAMSEAQTEPPSTIPEEDEHPPSPRLKAKHDTMQWSFSSAMAEASDSSSQPAAAPKRQASRRVPPPLKRSFTEPPSADPSRPSTSYSTTSTALNEDPEPDPFALESAANTLTNDHSSNPSIHLTATIRTVSDPAAAEYFPYPDPEPDSATIPAKLSEISPSTSSNLSLTSSSSSSNYPAPTTTVSLPPLRTLDPTLLDADADPSSLARELDSLLGEMRDVLAVAGAVLSGSPSGPADATRETHTQQQQQQIHGLDGRGPINRAAAEHVSRRLREEGGREKERGKEEERGRKDRPGAGAQGLGIASGRGGGMGWEDEGGSGRAGQAPSQRESEWEDEEDEEVATGRY